MYAVILGGGKSPVDPNLPKGNTPINGSVMAGRVYKSVIDGINPGRAALVMNPESSIDLRASDIFVDPTFEKGAIRSACRGITAIDDSVNDFIIAAGDLPLLTASTMRHFAEMAGYSNGEVVLGLVPREVNDKEFPTRSRTYQPFKEGDFLVANMGYASQTAIRANYDRAVALNIPYQDIAQTKNKIIFFIKVIRQVGIATILRAHHGKLRLERYIPAYDSLFPKFSLRQAEEVASEFCNANVRFIEFPHPESAFDVDSVGSLALAEDMLKPKKLEDRVA